MVQKTTWKIFKKSRGLVVTHNRIIELNSNNSIRFRDSYSDLMGLTHSLRIGAKNFILHYGSRADEELFSDKRDEIIECVAAQYKEKEQKELNIYGIASESLEDYLTTEKDLSRRISRMPNGEFLLKNGERPNTTELAEGDTFDDDDDLFDDFVLIEKQDFTKYNQKEKLDKEQKIIDSNPSTCLVARPGMTNPDNKPITLEDFRIQKVIDKGSFGKVFLVQNQYSKQMYAMKRINKDILIEKNQITNTKNEKDILFQASHPFVNSMDYVFQNELRIYFFLKYIPGGNIYDHLYKIRRFEEATVKFIGAQLVLALGYLHANKIVHRDLKPENVLMDADGYICLADFGLAKFLTTSTDQTYSFCGTAEYLAPEILDMQGHGFTVDWWTLGILLYEMVTGRPPFMHKSHHKLGVLIRNSRIIFPDPVKHGIPMSDELKDIISKLLDRNPKTRLGSKNDAHDLINHPFFADIDWEKLEQKQIKAKYLPEVAPVQLL